MSSSVCGRNKSVWSNEYQPLIFCWLSLFLQFVLFLTPNYFLGIQIPVYLLSSFIRSRKVLELIFPNLKFQVVQKPHLHEAPNAHQFLFKLSKILAFTRLKPQNIRAGKPDIIKQISMMIKMEDYLNFFCMQMTTSCKLFNILFSYFDYCSNCPVQQTFLSSSSQQIGNLKSFSGFQTPANSKVNCASPFQVMASDQICSQK